MANPRYAHKPTDDEVSKAKDTLERAYRGWVNDLAEELVFDTFNEEIDENDLQERIDERTDSGLIYTADQWTALFASRNTDAAEEEMSGMGYFDNGQPDNLVGVWATLTYRQDVNEALSETLLQPLRDGEDMDARVLWLRDEYGKKTVELKDEERATIIGDVEGTSFGILLLDSETDKHEFVGRSLEDDQLQVLLDAILEEGEFGERSKDVVRRLARAAAA